MRPALPDPRRHPRDARRGRREPARGDRGAAADEAGLDGEGHAAADPDVTRADFETNARREQRERACLPRIACRAARETAGEHGLAFTRDEQSLANKIAQLLANPELRAQLGRSAAEFARQNYGWDRVTQKYEALFAKMLK